MKLEFKKGYEIQAVEVNPENLLGILRTNPAGAKAPEQEILREALENPIGAPRLADIVRPGEKIAIISSDITRPMPTYTVMPALLDELYAAGIRKEDIFLCFARGIHRGHTAEEQRHLAGERAWKEIRLVDSNPEDTVLLGITSRGTPVEIDRKVAEADRRICLGNIEYHYFAGYSGGGKAIMPGVSTRAAVQANHRFMVEPGSKTGAIAGNPVREDLEEAAAIAGVDFILNVVLDEKKKVVAAFAGDMIKAHREGCAFLDRLYRKKIPARADIVLVSQGGAPKDLNLYQMQKALDNAKHAVKPGGVIILIGSCKEGAGESTFEQWMKEADTPRDLTERIQKDFRLGGHKAAAIAGVAELADIYLVSDLEPDYVKQFFMKPFPSAEAAYSAAREKCGEGATVLAMPYGGSTLPVL